MSFILEKKLLYSPSITCSSISDDIINIVSGSYSSNHITKNDNEETLLALSWMDQLADVLVPSLTTFEGKPEQNNHPSIQTSELSFANSISPIKDELDPTSYFEEAFIKSESIPLPKLRTNATFPCPFLKYLSFTMPGFLPFFLVSKNTSIVELFFISGDFPAPIANDNPITSYSEKPLSTDKDLLMKSIFLYLVSLHSLFFRPFSNELKPWIIPKLDAIKISTCTLSCYLTFPCQYPAYYNYEISKIDKQSSAIDHEFKIFINPLILTCLGDSSSLDSPNTNSSKVKELYLEHLDANHNINASHYLSKLEQVCKDNPSISSLKYYEGPPSLTKSVKVYCEWLDTKFIGEGKNYDCAKENAAQIAYEYYLNKYSNLSKVKNPDFIGFEKKNDDHSVTDDPSFSPLRNAKPVTISCENEIIKITTSEDYLKYSQYFMDLYQKSKSSKRDSTTSLRTTPFETERRQEAVLYFLPSILPPLNDNRKYISLLMEYCQLCRVEQPKFTISSHAAPFSGRCDWMQKAFFTENTFSRTQLYHHKKSDAKEELAKLAIGHLFLSKKITENHLFQLKVPELRKVLSIRFIESEYLKYSTDTVDKKLEDGDIRREKPPNVSCTYRNDPSKGMTNYPGCTRLEYDTSGFNHDFSERSKNNCKYRIIPSSSSSPLPPLLPYPIKYKRSRRSG